MGRRTTLEVDDALLEKARAALGTHGLKDTVDRALGEAVRRQRIERLLRRLKTGEGFDRELLSPEGRQKMWYGSTLPR
jgi:Arc/MetJ family transcription regulator